jgi:hypothetical protein
METELVSFSFKPDAVHGKAEHFNTDSGNSYSQPNAPLEKLNYREAASVFRPEPEVSL